MVHASGLPPRFDAKLVLLSAFKEDPPPPEPDAAGRCPVRQSFRFDTTAPGNGNGGHDYPWRYADPNRDPAALENLLEYLKTL